MNSGRKVISFHGEVGTRANEKGPPSGWHERIYFIDTRAGVGKTGHASEERKIDYESTRYFHNSRLRF